MAYYLLAVHSCLHCICWPCVSVWALRKVLWVGSHICVQATGKAAAAKVLMDLDVEHLSSGR